MRISLRTLNAIVLAVPLVLLGASHASAASEDSSSESSEQKKVAVGSFQGPKNDEVRDWVVKVLKDSNYDVVDAEIDNGKGNADYQKVGKELGVDAIVTGKVSKGFNLTVTVHNGADGTTLGDLDVKGGGFTAKRGTTVKGIALTDDPKYVEGKVNGIRIVLVAAYLKKA